MRTMKIVSFVAKLMIGFTILLLFMTILASSLLLPNSYAQSETEVKCGSIVDGEFSQEEEVHDYSLNMATGESFSASVDTVVDYLIFNLFAYGPTGKIVAQVTSWDASRNPSMSTGIIAKGKYKIRVTNSGTGPYKLYIGCVTVNGEVKPGDVLQPTPTPAPLPTPTPRSAIPVSVPEFAGVGFPGLAPIDFSSVAEIPLLLDTVMTGVIPTGNEILGFTLDAAAGDTLDLNYTRVSGNMNLGLVVLSEKNEVFFQASLVTSESLSTRFTLPAAGQYTIGVFRISLVEPTKVEPTVFQLKGALEHNN